EPFQLLAATNRHRGNKVKYQIGVGTISVSRDLRMAVKYLSTELYSKDAHFHNEYKEGVQPSLEFLLTSKDITSGGGVRKFRNTRTTGAPMTLLVFNNEKGFHLQYRGLLESWLQKEGIYWGESLNLISSLC
ncbi:hypothetical protein V2J09_022438, partial [Rumex salicifolius]